MTPARSGSAALACWMVLAVFVASWQSTAQASRLLTAFQQSFSASNSERSQMIRAELLHRDHPDSPLAPAEGATLADRMVAAVQRSVQSTSSRRQLADFQTPVELKGNYGGEYVMSISFGTPPQKFIELVDTGSGLVWVQCVPCPGCKSFVQPSPFYDPASSSSEKYISCRDPQCLDFSARATCSPENTCQIKYEYMDNSQIQGTLTTEQITIVNTAGASPVATGFVMGCMNNNTGIFDNYDGIVGFSRGDFSLPSQFSTIAYLHVFAYCLVPYTATTVMSSSMLFGSSDPTNALGLVYTPLLPIGSQYYYVNMTGISVDGVAVAIPASLFEYDATTDAGGVIFDSGTPITRFSTEVFGAIKLAFDNVLTYPKWIPTSADDPSIYYCFNISGVTNPVFPSVTFHYAGVDGSVVDFALAPENAFGPLWNPTDVSCLSMIAHSSADHIIGSIAQANHYIETDATVNMRMGWVTKDCTV